MTDVSEFAGVSRGTLYRYFPNKGELLDALARYEQLRFETGLVDAISLPAPESDSVQAMVDFAVAYLHEHPALGRMLESEPGFVLDYLRSQLPALHHAALRSIGPQLETSYPVESGLATTEQLVDLLIRMLVANFVAPSSKPQDDTETLRAMVELVMGAPSDRAVLRYQTTRRPATGPVAGGRPPR